MGCMKLNKEQVTYQKWVQWLRLTKKERKAIKKYRKEKKLKENGLVKV